SIEPSPDREPTSIEPSPDREPTSRSTGVPRLRGSGGAARHAYEPRSKGTGLTRTRLVTPRSQNRTMGDLPTYWPSTEDRRFPWPRAAFKATMLTRIHEASVRSSCDLTAVSRTAALLHDAETLPPGSRLTEWPVEFSLATRAQPPGSEPSTGFRFHRWNIPEDHVTEIDGVRTTDLERTIIDCARLLPRLEAQAAADQLLRKGASPERVRSLVNAQAWPTSQLKQLKAVLGDIDARSQSPMESWCRR